MNIAAVVVIIASFGYLEVAGNHKHCRHLINLLQCLFLISHLETVTINESQVVIVPLFGQPYISLISAGCRVHTHSVTVNDKQAVSAHRPIFGFIS